MQWSLTGVSATFSNTITTTTTSDWTGLDDDDDAGGASYLRSLGNPAVRAVGYGVSRTDGRSEKRMDRLKAFYDHIHLRVTTCGHRQLVCGAPIQFAKFHFRALLSENFPTKCCATQVALAPVRPVAISNFLATTAEICSPSKPACQDAGIQWQCRAPVLALWCDNMLRTSVRCW